MPFGAAMRRLTRRVAALEKGTEAAADAAPPPKAPTVAGVAPSQDVDALRDGLEAIRANLRAFGTAIGAGATTVLAGVGWATIHSLFPVPSSRGWIGWLAFALALAAVAGAFWLTAIFFSAQRRIVFKPSDPQRPAGFDPDEWQLVTATLTEHAQEENAASARALEDRALRLDRIARGMPAGTEEAKAVAAESDRLYTKLSVASLRAVVAVAERRSEAVFRLSNSAVWVPACLAALSIVGLFMLSDYSKGQRELLDLQATCVKSPVPGCPDVAGVTPATPAATLSSPAPVATAMIGRLGQCGQYASAQPAIPPSLVPQAVLTCAQIVPVPSPTPTPSTTPIPSATPSRS